MNALATVRLAATVLDATQNRKQSHRTLLISVLAGCLAGLFLILSFIPILTCLLLQGSTDATVPPEALTISDSGFCWPTPGYTTVTSPYGYRIHPITGKLKFHSGVDIGAKGGTPIVAAADGTVTISVYSNSYGNYVEIDHGGGVRTRYAHMSKRLCKVGDTVTQGETIGLVGSTGNSTGNHCHFEVRINGTTYDPMQYFSK